MEKTSFPTVEDTLNGFLKKITTHLSQYFGSADIAEKINENSYRIRINKDISVNMETLCEILEKTLKLYVLYAVGQHDEKVQTCVMYSRPYANNMYNIYMFSDDYGNISSFNIVIFISMDEQFIQLVNDLTKTKRMMGLYYAKQSPLQLSINFQ